MKTWTRSKKVSKSLHEISTIASERARVANTGQKYRARPVYVFDLEGNRIERHDSLCEACMKYTGQKENTNFYIYLTKKKPYNGYYFSYDMNLFNFGI